MARQSNPFPGAHFPDARDSRKFTFPISPGIYGPIYWRMGNACRALRRSKHISQTIEKASGSLNALTSYSQAAHIGHWTALQYDALTSRYLGWGGGWWK